MKQQFQIPVTPQKNAIPTMRKIQIMNAELINLKVTLKQVEELENNFKGIESLKSKMQIAMQALINELNVLWDEVNAEEVKK